jgi:hypothetical protein
MTRRRQVIIATLIMWCIGVVTIEGIRIRNVFEGPRDPEEYVYHLDFQLFASAFLVISRWLPLLLLVLLLEFGAFSLLSAVRRRFLARSME